VLLFFKGTDRRRVADRSRDAFPKGRRYSLFGLVPKWKGQRREHSPLDLLRRTIVFLLDRAFAGWPNPFESAWDLYEPWGLEVEETAQEVIVRAELPGFEASEFDVQLSGNLLTVRVGRPEETGATAPETVARRSGRLERTITLPAGVEPEAVEVCSRNGVLEIHMPKAPGAQPRRTDVTTASRPF
jgi:HSP20 family protein